MTKEILIQVFLFYEVPKEIVSDWGALLMSNVQSVVHFYGEVGGWAIRHASFD